MSIDKLQDRIRKTKNPTVIDLSVSPELLPTYLLESEGSFLPAYERFCEELLEALRPSVPAVRLGFDYFALLGAGGMEALRRVIQSAKNKGYYIFMDGPEMLSTHAATLAAETLLTEDYLFDGLILVSYIGSDGIRPYIDRLKASGKDLFVVVRTANKTAPELQDLLTGSRLVHLARADVVNRYAEPFVGRYGYSGVSLVAAASSADSLRNLRAKYKTMFLLLDGYDYANSNAKNCANAFDKLGHGAVVCAGASVTGAWKAEGGEGWRFAECSVAAADKMKKNLTRYVTVL